MIRCARSDRAKAQGLPKACCVPTGGSHSRHRLRSRARLPTSATRRGADLVLGGHGILGATRPPNKRFLGGLRERILHEVSALASIERDFIEKAAAGKLRRCIACELCRVLCRDAAGGGGSRHRRHRGRRTGRAHTVGLHIGRKESRALDARGMNTNLSLRSACTHEAMTASWPFWYSATEGDSSVL